MAIPTLDNVNTGIDPTADQVRAMRDADQSDPVVMLNLLKFREDAQYPKAMNMVPCSGREAYNRYQTAFVKTVGDVSQAEVVYDGPCEQVFIGLTGAPDTDWDKVLMVRYPERRHFLAMMANEDYRAALVHRYAALERTILIQCRG